MQAPMQHTSGSLKGTLLKRERSKMPHRRIPQDKSQIYTQLPWDRNTQITFQSQAPS